MPDLCSIDPDTREPLVPLAWLGDAYREVGRVEAEVEALRARLFDAEVALRLEREKPRWWWPGRR